MFERAKYDDVRLHFCHCLTMGMPVVHFGRGWKVLPNERYNIQGYDGLDICWVYNYGVDRWRRQIPDPLKQRIPTPDFVHQPPGDFERFPWYRTFGETGKALMDLTEQQVALLAHLSCWNITNDETQREIESFLWPSR